MPTYDYVCDACDHKFELFQSINDPVKKKCPSCKKSKLRRLFGTGGAIMFKGSGFYTTDYRSDNYKKQAKADSGGSDSKPAEKSESKSSGGNSSGGNSSGGNSSGGNSSGSDSSSKPSSSESKPAKKTDQ